MNSVLTRVLVVLMCTRWVQTLSWCVNFDAYTLVTLTTVHSDDALYSAFYHARANTVLDIWPDGAASLRMTARHSAAHNTLTASLTTSPHAATTTALLPRLPFRARLSNEWVVLEHCPDWAHYVSRETLPLPDDGEENGHSMHTTSIHRTQESASTDSVVLQPCSSSSSSSSSGSAATLLHCRLPLPQNVEQVRQAQQKYLATHEARVSEAIASWWQRVGHGRNSGCLYGDGESAFTHTPRYYIVCPQASIYRIHHVYLYWLMQQQDGERQTKPSPSNAAPVHSRSRDANANVNSMENSSGLSEDGHIQRNGNRIRERGMPRAMPDDFVFDSAGKRKLVHFLEKMHHSRSRHRSVLQSTAFAQAFESIGDYTPHHSRPKWNTELLAWEMHYPSSQRCYENDSVPRRRRAASHEKVKPRQYGDFFVNGVLHTIRDILQTIVDKIAPTRAHRVGSSSVTAAVATSVHDPLPQAHNSSHASEKKTKSSLVTWQTVVRIRCADTVPDDIKPSSTTGRVKRRSGQQRKSSGRRRASTARDRDEAVQYWSITEVRQTCTYEVEISTPFVCVWDDNLDSFSVNPIPCVHLD